MLQDDNSDIDRKNKQYNIDDDIDVNEKVEIQSVLRRPFGSGVEDQIVGYDVGDMKLGSTQIQASPKQKRTSCIIDEAKGTGNKAHTERQSKMSSSQMTSNRSHFTSIEGPPKIYEEIMRSLEADVRKHIRIEHQLKLHIESVEDRVEELEREAEQYDEFIEEYKENKKECKNLRKELASKGEMLEVKEILIEKLNREVSEMEKDHSLKNEQY